MPRSSATGPDTGPLPRASLSLRDPTGTAGVRFLKSSWELGTRRGRTVSGCILFLMGNPPRGARGVGPMAPRPRGGAPRSGPPPLRASRAPAAAPQPGALSEATPTALCHGRPSPLPPPARVQRCRRRATDSIPSDFISFYSLDSPHLGGC